MVRPIPGISSVKAKLTDEKFMISSRSTLHRIRGATIVSKRREI
jgi:hypothetical protein